MPGGTTGPIPRAARVHLLASWWPPRGLGLRAAPLGSLVAEDALQVAVGQSLCCLPGAMRRTAQPQGGLRAARRGLQRR